MSEMKSNDLSKQLVQVTKFKKIYQQRGTMAYLEKSWQFSFEVKFKY